MNVEIIGDGDGSEYTINGVSHKPDSYDPSDPDYRIELSPSEEVKTDRILTVMYVTDAKSTAPVLNAEPIETDELAGAILLGRAMVFPKNERYLSGSYTFTTVGEGTLTYLVAGVAPGEWQIETDGDKVDSVIAADGDGVISFTAKTGKITFKLL
jgi:hypothetical protein